MSNIFKYKGINYWFIPFFIALFFALQYPFLDADPFLGKVDFSRDALTDEGLNTAQLSNFTNAYGFGLDENANLIKIPAFNAYLLPISFLTNNAQVFSRFWMLAGFIFLNFLIFRKMKLKQIYFGVIILLATNFYIFQYSRFTMAEVLASYLIFYALQFLADFFETENRKTLLYFSLTLFLAFLFKIQFIYIYPMLFVFFVCLKKENRMKINRKIGFILLLNLALFALFFLLWVLPNWEVFIKVFKNEASGRVMHPRFWTTQALDQFCMYMLDVKNAILLVLLILAVVYFFIFKKINQKSNLYLLSLFSLIWVLVECHKFFIWYVPPRYLISTFIAFSFFIFIQLMIFFQNKHQLVFKSFVFALLTLLLLTNSYSYTTLFQVRTYVIKTENVWFKKQVKKGDLVAGVWGCILAKESGAKIIPVWDKFFNDKDLIQKFDPKIIITEVGEGESVGAFTKNDIDLEKIALKKHFIKYGKHKIIAYILK